MNEALHGSSLAGSSSSPLVNTDVIEAAIADGLRRGGSFVEIFVEDQSSLSASLDDNTIESVYSTRRRGAGIRVIEGEATGFAHTSDLSPEGLGRAIEAAAVQATRSNKGVRTVGLESPKRVTTAQVIETWPQTVAKAEKVALLTRANDAAREASRTGKGAISQVSVAYSDTVRNVQIANSEGVHVTEEQVRTGFAVSCLASRGDLVQTGFSSLRQTKGFEVLLAAEAEDVAREAARVALLKLEAQPAPSGPMPVVIHKGAGGVLFHEACGHGLEADGIAKGASVFTGRRGEQVASPLVSLVDDGTMAGEWGSYGVDDEGHQAQRNMLIHDGELTDYMWDHLRAVKVGRESSGNGRRQSYEHLPMVRMTNTFVAPGSLDPDELITNTPHGLYVVGFGGGNVETATGDFVFSLTEAYLIENGRVTAPVRDAVLMGNGPEVLTHIDGVANDFSFGWGGTCGKNGQSVPVGLGQPTLRVPTGLTVGGTAA